MSIVVLNINRLNHLLTLYGVTRGELLKRLNVKRKNPLKEADVFNKEIKLSILKKIDSVFHKGLSFYIDPKEPTQSKEESIFFRKDNFNAKLNLGAKQIVTKFEEEKIAFSTLAKLSDFKIKRNIPVFKITDNPEVVASEIRKTLYAEFNIDKKEFLKNFISKFADNNILVFEFVETHNKKEKANINGFYLTPNVIVLKRNQKSFSREIFTLAHELGHYLLNEEEIDDNVSEINVEYNKLNKIERWCNDFAYFFLAGQYSKVIEKLDAANSGNDYHHETINEVSKHTHLSTISLYTRLLLSNKISPFNYKQVTDEILVSIKDWEEREKERLERERQKAIDEGRTPQASAPKPIISPLYLKTLQSALYNNLINEADFCRKLNVKPEKVGKYLT
ncbi:ImmA/IrrE family metallo-endopeptidase [Sediminibacterium sp.]|uniref:ImmA/IrrE family metallo-endopeptidase n=1 Tax=Sediminibacterium sp. TaxID=1917865 RepID=UPI0025CD73FA|nr:ImmA/IrrE family metallo-endopeptidase [Sediminibacterium sp.]MBW0176834.1 ImmA/IrrE family metallo-endopeptidase [Sediminibacterium sp.]